MKKILIFLTRITLTCIMLFCSVSADVYSQTAGAFEVIVLPTKNDSATPAEERVNYYYSFHQCNDSTYFPALYSIFIRNDKTGEITEHSKYKFPEVWEDMSCIKTKITPQPYSNKLWIYGGAMSDIGSAKFITIEDGVFKREIIGEKYEKWDTLRDVTRVASFPRKEWEQHYTEKDACFYYMNHYMYYVGSDLHVAKNTITKMSPTSQEKVVYEIIDTITPMEENSWESPFAWTTGYLGDEYWDNASIVMPDSTVWMVANTKHIVKFDDKTKEFSNWHVDSILSPFDIVATLSSSQLFLMRDDENYRNSKVSLFLGEKAGIISWDNGKWNREEVDFSGSKTFTEAPEKKHGFELIQTPFYWGKDEIAFPIAHSKNAENTVLQSLSARTLIIYNYKTKKARDFIIPVEAFNGNEDVLTKSRPIQGYDKVSKRNFTRCIKELNDGCKGILIALDGFCEYRGVYVIYDPEKDESNSISNEVDGILPNLWFKKVYPNPVKHTLNAEVWCFLRDISDLDLGLYNFMGQKILNLNNDFEYDAANRLIRITAKIPQDISAGLYFLNINNGSEHKTQAVAIGIGM